MGNIVFLYGNLVPGNCCLSLSEETKRFRPSLPRWRMGDVSVCRCRSSYPDPLCSPIRQAGGSQSSIHSCQHVDRHLDGHCCDDHLIISSWFACSLIGFYEVPRHEAKIVVFAGDTWSHYDFVCLCNCIRDDYRIGKVSNAMTEKLKFTEQGGGEVRS